MIPVNVANLQLQAASMLAVLWLVLHEAARPFKHQLLNCFERLALTATAVSFSLVACAESVPSHAGSLALVVLLVALNGSVGVFFLYLTLQQLYKSFKSKPRA
jgi:hypothetical protein